MHRTANLPGPKSIVLRVRSPAADVGSSDPAWKMTLRSCQGKGHAILWKLEALEQPVLLEVTWGDWRPQAGFLRHFGGIQMGIWRIPKCSPVPGRQPSLSLWVPFPATLLWVPTTTPCLPMPHSPPPCYCPRREAYSPFHSKIFTTIPVIK